MSTTLVVDGYNAINAIEECRRVLEKGDLEGARKAIMDICREYVRSSGYITGLCVVFDGQDKYRAFDAMGGPRQVFSATGEGDDKIIQTVNRYSRSGKVIVVSNDNYVRNMSRGYGAALLSSEDLLFTKKGKRKNKRVVAVKNIGKELASEITKEYMEELGL